MTTQHIEYTFFGLWDAPSLSNTETALERSKQRWSLGKHMLSLVEMSEVYASMPERDDNNREYHQRFGHIVLGYN